MTASPFVIRDATKNYARINTLFAVVINDYEFSMNYIPGTKCTFSWLTNTDVDLKIIARVFAGILML